jgi:Yip1 domain
MSTTTVATPAPEPEPQASLSPISRLFGVFFSPGATFTDIVRKPSWIVPVAVSTVLSLIAIIALNQRVDWRDFVSQQIDKSPRAASLSPDQKQQQIEMGAKIAPISVYVVGTAYPIVAVLCVALVMWGAYTLLAGIRSNYGSALGIASHAFLPMILNSLLFIVIVYIKPVGTVDLENPVATNIAALLPEDSAKWLATLCKSIDVFNIWIVVLIAIGFAALNPRKLKGGKSFTIAFSVWAVWILLRVGWALAFS